MLNGTPPWAREIYSEPRLSRYIRSCNGNQERAWHLYEWNTRASAAFYDPLHTLEVGMRNTMNMRMRSRFGIPSWWDTAPLTMEAKRLVAKAHDKAKRSNRKLVVSADDVVAELTFGFWVALLSKRYVRVFWEPCLQFAFPYSTISRRDLHDQLTSVVLFRNRIMHYEPIYHRDLRADYAKIVRLISYFSQDAATALKSNTLVPDVLDLRP